MKKIITFIIVVAFAVNSAGQGYALRPMASAKKMETSIKNRLTTIREVWEQLRKVDRALIVVKYFDDIEYIIAALLSDAENEISESDTEFSRTLGVARKCLILTLENIKKEDHPDKYVRLQVLNDRLVTLFDQANEALEATWALDSTDDSEVEYGLEGEIEQRYYPEQDNEFLRYFDQEDHNVEKTSSAGVVKRIHIQEFMLDSEKSDSIQYGEIGAALDRVAREYGFLESERHTLDFLAQEAIINAFRYGNGGKFTINIIEERDGRIGLELVIHDRDGKLTKSPEEIRRESERRYPSAGRGFRSYGIIADGATIEPFEGKKWTRHGWPEFDLAGESSVEEGVRITLIVYSRDRYGNHVKLPGRLSSLSAKTSSAGNTKTSFGFISDMTKDELYDSGIAKLVIGAPLWPGWDDNYWDGRDRDAMVLYEDNVPVGVYSFVFLEEHKVHADGVFINTEGRGKGFGQLLRNELLQHLKRKGITEFLIGGNGANSISEDKGAQRFHEILKGKIGVKVYRNSEGLINAVTINPQEFLLTKTSSAGLSRVLLNNISTGIKFSKGGKTVVVPYEILERLKASVALARRLKVELSYDLVVKDGVVFDIYCPQKEEEVAVLTTKLSDAIIKNSSDYHVHVYIRLIELFSDARTILGFDDPDDNIYTPEEMARFILSDLTKLRDKMQEYKVSFRLFSPVLNQYIDFDSNDIQEIIEMLGGAGDAFVARAMEIATHFMGMSYIATKWVGMFSTKPTGSILKEAEIDYDEIITIHNHPNGYPSPPSTICTDPGNNIGIGDVFQYDFFSAEISGLILDSKDGDELFLLYEEDDSNRQQYFYMFSKFWLQGKSILDDLRKVSMSPSLASAPKSSSAGTEAVPAEIYMLETYIDIQRYQHRRQLQALFYAIFSKLKESRITQERVAELFKAREEEIFSMISLLHKGEIRTAVLDGNIEDLMQLTWCGASTCGECNKIKNLLLLAARDAGFDAGPRGKDIFAASVNNKAHTYIVIAEEDGNIAVDIASGAFIHENLASIVVSDADTYKRRIDDAVLQAAMKKDPDFEVELKRLEVITAIVSEELFIELSNTSSIDSAA
ncbi:MAG: GNAT family N-acetyltransferase [Candidatus Omnitrophica bacterium]|nr:GNAT family N-acetyltransferase [Candidatus Omnitrophota bacterium]